jgi:hypothetical protein
VTRTRREATTTPTSQVRVFINYRRADTRHVAGRLHDLIVAQFGESSVFVDVEDIEPGMDYVSAIDSAVSSCLVMLVLVGDKWLDATDAEGRRRIDDPADRLRLEVEAGLRHSTRVIPVLVDSASMPKTRDLPQSLVPLSRHHAIRLQHDSFSNDARNLLGVIERIAGESPQRPRPRPPRPDDQRPPPRRHPRISLPTVLRWSALVLLLLALVVILATSGTQGDSVATAHPNIADTGPWGTVVWLLPAVPVVVAACLLVASRLPGVAVGLLAGALLWVVNDLILIRAVGDDASASVTVLAILAASLLCLVAVDPAMTRASGWNDPRRAAVALVLLLVALVLRVYALPLSHLLTDGTSPRLSPNLGGGFWISVLLPLTICLPAALMRSTYGRARAIRTASVLVLVYPVVVRIIAVATGANGGALLILLFLTGTACVVGSAFVGTGSAGRLQAP